jgi:hypothetical protein
MSMERRVLLISLQAYGHAWTEPYWFRVSIRFIYCNVSVIQHLPNLLATIFLQVWTVTYMVAHIALTRLASEKSRIRHLTDLQSAQIQPYLVCA